MTETAHDVRQQVRQALDALAAQAVDWKGPLPDGDLAEHLDSMSRLALVVAVEDHFRIAFDPEDDEEVRTVDDVVDVVLRKAADVARAG